MGEIRVKVMLKSVVTIILSVVLLCACEERLDLAPVVELKWKSANSQDKTYVVTHGDTLYSIAFRYDLDYRQLAEFNHLQSPYLLRIGQVLQLKSQNLIAQPQRRNRPVHPNYPRRYVPSPVPSLVPPRNINWTWPAHGHVMAKYNPDRGMKGIIITGNRGNKIYSAGNGIVAYAGNGLVGYGNLIIIKHGSQFLTAYGNNQRNLVREGQVVKKGQEIADMGIIDRRYWGVHFEIRHRGKPVDPMIYLK